MSEWQPKVFGPYELVKHLGSGGMGQAYIARRTEPPFLAGRVVVKILRPDLADDVNEARLRREAQLCLAFDHPAIVRVYEYGQVDGVSYLAMAHVSGLTMSQFIQGIGHLGKGTVVPEGLVAYVGAELASAIGYAHQREVIHRDLSPGNVIFSESGEVKLLDFGVARPHESTLTHTGLFVGKWAYAAPETILWGQISAAADVYGLGVCLIELATKARLYATDLAEDSIAVRTDVDVRERLRNASDLGEALQDVLIRAVAIEPENRFENGEELWKAINEALPSGVHALTLSDMIQDVKTAWPEVTTQRRSEQPTVTSSSQAEVLGRRPTDPPDAREEPTPTDTPE